MGGGLGLGLEYSTAPLVIINKARMKETASVSDTLRE